MPWRGLVWPGVLGDAMPGGAWCWLVMKMSHSEGEVRADTARVPRLSNNQLLGSKYRGDTQTEREDGEIRTFEALTRWSMMSLDS